MAKAKGRTVTVLAVDPGSTTGVVIVTIDASWVRGLGVASWDGLGAVVRAKTAYQLGREPKTFNLDTDRTTQLDRERMDDLTLPILAGQPLVEADNGRKFANFYAIIEGDGPAGGGELSMMDANEIVTVRQIAGLLDNYPTSALVIEDFSLRTPVRGREVTSPDRLRLSITANEVLHGEGRTPFLQQPAYAKTTATDERLKRAGLYFPGMPHATDAARHAVTFLREARQHESVRALAWPVHFADGFED